MPGWAKWALIGLGLLTFIGIILSSGCAPEEEAERARERETTTTEARRFTNADYDELMRNPGRFEGAQGTVYGRVFNVVEGSHLQIFIDLENDRQFVLQTESSRGIREDDFVKAEGEFTGIETFTNPFGGEISAPVIDLGSIEEVDPLVALPFMAPAFRTVEINQTVDQHGFAVTLVWVEFADDHTRALFRVRNGTSDAATLFVSSAVAVQGSKQFETEFVFDFPELQSDYQPGTEAEGYIFFEPLDVGVGQARFSIDGYSENFDIDIEPFVFNVSW